MLASRVAQHARGTVQTRARRSVAVSALPKLKLIYFQLPGRAETARILLKYGGIPFEDYILQREQWPEMKLKMPLGQVPVLEVDGKMLAQSAAIERYAAKLAGLMPEDPWKAAKVDEVVAFLGEVQDLFVASFSIKDAEAKIKARQDIVAGPLKDKFSKLAGLLAAAGGKFIAGDEPTYADIATFHMLSNLASGFLDGVPTTLLDAHPELKAYHNRVAELPPVAKMYEQVTEGLRLAYKPL